MLVSIRYVRVGARRLVTGTLLLIPAAACSGGDLTLPDNSGPIQLMALSGSGQTALVGSPVRHPLVVQAIRDSRPVPGAVVVFEFLDPPNGGAITTPVLETDSEGQAAVEVTLGTPAGDQPVEARLNDPEQEVADTFLLTAIQTNDPGDGGGGGGPPPDDGGGGDGGGDGGGGGGGGGAGGGDDDGNGGGGDDDGGGGGGGDNDGDGDGDGDGGGGGGDDDDGQGGGDNGNDGSGKDDKKDDDSGGGGGGGDNNNSGGGGDDDDEEEDDD